MGIYLYCSGIPAANYKLGVWMDNGRIVCGRQITGYVYISDDLLDKIAGKHIDITELTEG
jgi:hypothetical protein